MNNFRLPPLNSLKSFAALALAGSYAETARMLGVTPAAISQQIKILEDHLAISLVRKLGRSIVLTNNGKLLSDYLQDGFSQFRAGIEAVAKQNQMLPIGVTTSPGFATYWLLPRLSQFQHENPDIPILLHPTSKEVDLERPEIDIAIRFCHKNELPVNQKAFMQVSLNVVGDSKFTPASFESGIDLAKLPWIQELGMQEANAWFSRHNIPLEQTLRVSEMPGNLLIDSLRRGNLIAYTVCDWIETDLKNGYLQELWPQREAGLYYILTDTSSPRRSVARFVNWLIKQPAAPGHR